MMRFIVVILALTFSGEAAAQQITTSGIGRAEAEARRVLVVSFSGTPFVGDNDVPLPAAGANPAEADPIKDIIRRSDPTAVERSPAELSALLGHSDQTEGYLSMMVANSSLTIFEVDAHALGRVQQALAPFRRLAHVAFLPLPVDEVQLRRRAMELAIANARERAAVVAAASGFTLGDIYSIVEDSSPSTAPSNFAVALSGISQPPPPDTKAAVVEHATVAFSVTLAAH